MQLKSTFTPHFILWTLSILLQYADSKPQVPCYFVFGDSLSDNGNNNKLPTTAKVNYPPYGIDFPGSKPTGRFSNGRNIVDFIAMHLGFKKPAPPFASTSQKPGKKLLKGVNYASGGAGIRPETGQHMGVVIPLEQQLLNHQTVISKIATTLGKNTSKHLSKCLYTINIGSNDYLNNYFLPEKNYSTSKLFSPDEYARELIQQYSLKIKMLHGMGARKMALFKLGIIGCTPQAISKFGQFGILCSTKVNVAATLFNKRLEDLMEEHNRNLQGANFTCINMDEIFLTSFLAFLPLTTPCCKVRGDGQCQNDSVPCPLRKSMVFYDNFHPTEAFNKLTGRRAYRATTPLDAHPVDIRTLVQL